MTLKWDDKDPNDVDYFDLDWSERLVDSETVSTSTWIITPATITQNSDSHTTTVSRVWLSGGTDGEVYDLTNRIVTSGGRTLDQTVRLKVKSH